LFFRKDAMKNYYDYLYDKIQLSGEYGIDPVFMPDVLFDFQKHLVQWAIRKGRCAIFADCGLGKTLMQLVWAQNIVMKTNKPVLIITPLSVSKQTELEAEKFGIEAERSKDGKYTKKIVITNYERMHYFNENEFEGVVCDESSILKNYDGKTKDQITKILRKIKYRLLATATAAPNDYIELGTSSEALGYLGHMDMLGKFFKNDQNSCDVKSKGKFIDNKWRLKGHAHQSFWRWITSWSRSVRYPSDLGFDNQGFNLPELRIDHNKITVPGLALDGYFKEFCISAIGLKEEREEIRKTINQRCEIVAEKIIDKNDYSVSWCNLNDEGDLLEKIIPGSVQVSGKDSDDKKEEKLINFTTGQYKHIIIKPKIGGFGLNWQHCNYMTFFPTHSYEQFYQAVRRCYRFGQKRPVSVDLIYTEGMESIVGNLERKRDQADKMFESMVKEMNNALTVKIDRNYKEKEIIPKWL
jgi:hypothetical protein